MTDFESVATYIRWSSEKQDKEHQRDDIAEWLDRRGMSIGDTDVYSEQASGASTSREGFSDLVNAVENDEYSDVVVWEISRIAREGELAQKFFNTCEDTETTIHVTNGSVRVIEPDGHGRLVADIIASVAAEERRRLISRTKSGLRRARKEGKWLGQVPKGFVRVDGYLKPNLNPDYDEEETGYMDMVDAIEAIDNGASFRATANETPNVTRQTLSSIYHNRDGWYLEAEADDERVDEALSLVEEEQEA
jgi:DNA invertase Pin-like site-specific DNA recombinase